MLNLPPGTWGAVITLLSVTALPSRFVELALWQQAVLASIGIFLFLGWIAVWSLIQEYLRRVAIALCKTCWPALLLIAVQTVAVLYFTGASPERLAEVLLTTLTTPP